jgi:hypothetical protein
MEKWNAWFDSIADIQVEKGGLREGREISPSGVRKLPFGKDSITGYTIIEALSLDEAERIAKESPVIASTKVYEIRGG